MWRCSMVLLDHDVQIFCFHMPKLWRASRHYPIRAPFKLLHEASVYLSGRPQSVHLSCLKFPSLLDLFHPDSDPLVFHAQLCNVFHTPRLTSALLGLFTSTLITTTATTTNYSTRWQHLVLSRTRGGGLKVASLLTLLALKLVRALSSSPQCLVYLPSALKDAQGDVLSHNTIQVLPAPPCELSSIHYPLLPPLLTPFFVVTAKEKERNLARFQRCPLPSVIFTGREEALRKICDRLLEPSTRTRIFVLYGLGGAGKSQITFQFVHTHCYGKDANVVPRCVVAMPCALPLFLIQIIKGSLSRSSSTLRQGKPSSSVSPTLLQRQGSESPQRTSCSFYHMVHNANHQKPEWQDYENRNDYSMKNKEQCK